jgi:hypothetical protein
MRSRHMLADNRLFQLFEAFYPADLFEGTGFEAPRLASGGIDGALTRLGLTQTEYMKRSEEAGYPYPQAKRDGAC